MKLNSKELALLKQHWYLLRDERLTNGEAFKTYTEDTKDEVSEVLDKVEGYFGW